MGVSSDMRSSRVRRQAAKKPNKERTVQVRFSDEELAALDAICSEKKMTRSADLHLGAGFDIQDVYSKLTGMLGVLEHGLFLNMCKRMIVGHSDGTVDVIENPSK